MKTSTVTPSFYKIFNITLHCNDTIPSFIGNLWRFLLLGNHLNSIDIHSATTPKFFYFLFFSDVSLGGTVAFSSEQNMKTQLLANHMRTALTCDWCDRMKT